MAVSCTPHTPAVQVRWLHSVSTPGHSEASAQGGVPLELVLLLVLVLLVLEALVLLVVVLDALLVLVLVLEALLVLEPELDEPDPPAPPVPTSSVP
jgi:uncharacterized membrane protein YhaH (DUF805 family)